MISSLLDILQNHKDIRQHDGLAAALGPRSCGYRVRVNPNFRMPVAIRTDHLPAHLHKAIGVRQLHERLHYLNLVRAPMLRLADTELHMYFISVDMVDALVVLMVEENATNIGVGLLHTTFE